MAEGRVKVTCMASLGSWTLGAAFDCAQVWVRELAAALMDMGSRPDGTGKASVEELVLAGVRRLCSASSLPSCHFMMLPPWIAHGRLLPSAYLCMFACM